MNAIFKFLLIHISLFASNVATMVSVQVIPVLKFIEGIKYFQEDDEQITFDDFKLQAHLTARYGFSESLFSRLLEAAVTTIKLLFPEIDKKFTKEMKADYNINVLLAFLNYIKTPTDWQKEMFWLKLASGILMELVKSSGQTLKDHEATTLVQLAYSDNKLHKRF